MAEHLAGRPPIVCEIFYEREVVMLQVFMGRASFLDVEGHVWYENFGEGDDPKILRDARDIASEIVRWSGAIGLPELIDMLPSRPETAVVCGICGGSRWFPASMMVSLEGKPLRCLRCYGLGWTLA
ncbi:hypothetical protein [Singulisphaera sp. PoT]|uniref:hypothetical protein n=1 Tax=Singulisphaera sp. PoT TaxID=3411797 RepID=UPI003BF50A52